MTHTEMTTADVRRAVVQHAARVGYPPLPAAEVEARFDRWLATITRPEAREITAEELDALPHGSVVLDSDGDAWVRRLSRWWYGPGLSMTSQKLERTYSDLSLRVLYVPEEATR